LTTKFDCDESINAGLTFQALASDRSGFANLNVCVKEDRFVVHFGWFILP
jgi:hypothetical protein